MDFFYFISKALHLIFMTTWFAGMFYMVRLLVYHSEAYRMEEPIKTAFIEQYKKMEKRLWYGITYPSMAIVLIFGIIMLVKNPEWMKNGLMHVKLTLVVLLIGYHHMIGAFYKKMKNGTKIYSSYMLRIMNEVATIFLFSIIAIAVFLYRPHLFKDNWYIVAGGLLIIIVLIFSFIKKNRA